MGRRNKEYGGESSWHPTGTCASCFAVRGRRVRVERQSVAAPDIGRHSSEKVGRPARETGAWADSRCLHRWDIGPRRYSAFRIGANFRGRLQAVSHDVVSGTSRLTITWNRRVRQHASRTPVRTSQPNIASSSRSETRHAPCERLGEALGNFVVESANDESPMQRM